MKFYNLEVFLQEENRYQNLGRIIVEHGMHGYREAVTKVPLQKYKKDKPLKLEDVLHDYGFYFCILEQDCVEKNYAKKEDVEAYIQNIDKHPFHKYMQDHQYVYGTDHDEVKQMIKEYRKTK